MNFDLTCQLFKGGDPAIETYENGEYRRIIKGKLVRVKQGSSGLIITPPDPEIVKKVNFMFDTDRNLDEFEQAMQDDKVLSNLIPKIRGLKPIFTETVFEAMIKAIVEQQIALKAAISIQGKLIKKFGREIEGHYAFPEPESLCAAAIEELRSCGLSNSKAHYVQNIANAVLAGLDLEALKTMPNQEVMETLMEIKGVGPWTAEYAMVRGMGRLDSAPAGDLGFRKAVGRLYFGKEIASESEVRSLFSKWGEWRGYACFYLIREKGLLIDKR